MGCRGTIEIWENGDAPKSEERPVVLYTHWGAREMEDDLRDVLSRKLRWNDPSYLSRMIFSRMIRNDIDGELNYGILTDNVGDAEVEIIVDCNRQEVIVKGWDENDTYTFDEFIDPDELLKQPTISAEKIKKHTSKWKEKIKFNKDDTKYDIQDEYNSIKDE
jgi:hypothetical protein